MAEKNFCIACGKEYEVCPNCPDSTSFVPWRRRYCSVDCFKAFEIARSYANNEKTKEEAYESLSNIKNKDFSEFNTATGEIIRKIMYREPEMPVEEINEASVTINDEEVSEVAPAKIRTKRKKVSD